MNISYDFLDKYFFYSLLLWLYFGTNMTIAQDSRTTTDGYFNTPVNFILPSHTTGNKWRYTFSMPASYWYLPAFDDQQWQAGDSGFYFGGALPGDQQKTYWPAQYDTLWARTHFTIQSSEIEQLILWGRWDDQIDIFINGIQAAKVTTWSSGETYIGISDAARMSIRPDEVNTLAVKVSDFGGGKYLSIGLALTPEMNAIPITGSPINPALTAFGSLIQDYMQKNAIPSAVFAIRNGTNIVASQGFGYQEKSFNTPVQPGSVMRLASNDKPITETAINKIIADGTVNPNTGQLINNDTRVFPLLNALGLTPLDSGISDSRINDITILQLKNHTSGLAHLPEGDLTAYYAALEKSPGTTTVDDVARWVYSQNLRFKPGEKNEYNSTGYAILRYIIYRLKSGNLEQWLQNELFAPLGNTDIYIARERIHDRHSSEPWYATHGESYDRWVNLDEFTALASSADAFVRYQEHYGFGLFYGNMSGSWTEGRGLPGQRSYALFFNRSGYWDALGYALERLANTLPSSAWLASNTQLPDNNRPYASTPFDSITLRYQAPTLRLNLNHYFADKDNDTLSYSAIPFRIQSGQYTSLQVSGNNLEITTNNIGDAQYVITAFDGQDITFAILNITVNNSNNSPPLVAKPIPNQFREIAITDIHDLSEVFVDPDGNSLTISASSSQPSIITAAVNNGKLFLDYLNPGQAVITLSAHDGQSHVELHFNAELFDNNFTHIQNYWAPGWYIHDQYHMPQASEIASDWDSAFWHFEKDGEYYRIRSKSNPDNYLHIEYGQLHSGPISPNWWSAQWLVSKVTASLSPALEGKVYKIQNRWKPEQFLHIEYGHLTSAPAEDYWWSTRWIINNID